MLEAFRAGDLTVGLETFRRNKLDNRKVLWRWSEVLPQSEHLAIDLTQVVHRLKKFRLLFAKPQHHSAHCNDRWAELFRFAQDLERGAIFRARTHNRSEERRVGKEGRSRWSP